MRVEYIYLTNKIMHKYYSYLKNKWIVFEKKSLNNSKK